MKKWILLLLSIVATQAQADVTLYPGEEVELNGEIVSCVRSRRRRPRRRQPVLQQIEFSGVTSQRDTCQMLARVNAVTPEGQTVTFECGRTIRRGIGSLGVRFQVTAWFSGMVMPQQASAQLRLVDSTGCHFLERVTMRGTGGNPSTLQVVCERRLQNNRRVGRAVVQANLIFVNGQE